MLIKGASFETKKYNETRELQIDPKIGIWQPSTILQVQKKQF